MANWQINSLALSCVFAQQLFLLCELDVHAQSSEILTVFSIHFFTASLLFLS